ncbi:MAG: hypothetical protein GEV07_06920 [Streptosporangiales bacterium]|nr:hypothetical protein [Streptosporangiales bacterium]
MEVFRAAVEETGAEASVVQMRPRPQAQLRPTEVAAAAFHGAALVIELTSRFVQHSKARQDGQQRGLRYLFIGDIDADMLRGPGAVCADFHALAPRIERVADFVTNADRMRLTSAAGTDITVSAEGRPGRALTGLATQPGQFGAPPFLEAGVVPVAGTANGTVVVDAYCVGIGLVDEAFTVQVESGRVVDIDGGPQGAELMRLLRSADNPNAFGVSEIGIGLNDQAKLIDNVTSAEACYGTAHVAVGTTPADPGIDVIDGGLHVDMVFRSPTIEIGDQVVMHDGALVDP